MPFVISNPHTSPSGAVHSSSGGRVRKRDRRRGEHHRSTTGQRPKRKTRARHRSTSSSSAQARLPQRSTSISGVLSGIIQQQYRKKRSQGPQIRTSTTSSQLCTPRILEERRPTVVSSASFSFGSHTHRLSSVSFGSSGLGGHQQSHSEQPSPIAEYERPSTPAFIDQAQPTDAKVAFRNENLQMSRSYVHMGETTAPSVFLTGLSAQCIHTLYAGSFVIYGTNLAADWFHTYYACKGWSVTFALRPWLTIWMMCCCACGAVFNFLLLYLCIENALRRKWEAEPYKGGFRLIFQRFGNWVTDFDCFRISFLILILENTPMTVINYWFISSCSIPRPGKIGWTFVFACVGTILSVLWRAVMTFLAYRNLRCLRYHPPTTTNSRKGSKRAQNAAAYFQLEQNPGAMTIGEIQHQKLEARMSGSSTSTMDELRSLASGDRTNHYDECWPIRMSCWVMYNQRDDVEGDSATGGSVGEGSTGRPMSSLPPIKPPDNCLGYCCQASCCFCLCILFYAGMLATGCAPCAYHYTCRRNSRVHRNKFAKTCTRICSITFNVCVVVTTVFLVISILVINLIWLSSVHVIGNHRTPPEIDQICLFVDPDWKLVHPTLMTSIIPRDNRRSANIRVDCRSIFDLHDQWGFWWQRSDPGPWLYHGIYGPDTLAVKTDTVIGKGADEITMIYAQFVHGSEKDCSYVVHENWTIIDEMPFLALPWPYWTACDKAYVIEEKIGDCAKPSTLLG